MADLTGKLKLDTSDFNAKADAAAKKAEELGNKSKAAAEQNSVWASSYAKVTLMLTGLNQGMQIASQVIQGVEKAYDATVGAFTDYADSMRLSAQATGVTTEEMSKLVQAADDFRVPVETMQKSMELALKNGFTPTIENLATLSDKLLAIKDPAERAAEASEIFGKSYADMMPFLLAGGDAIRTATENISANLIVSTEAALKAKEYKDSLDELGDTWTGVMMVMGEAFTPVANNVLKDLTAQISSTISMIRLLGMADDALGAGKINLGDYLDIIGDTTGDVRLPGWQKEVNKHLLDLGLALNKTTPEVAAYRAEQKGLGDDMANSSDTWEEYREKVLASGQAMDLMSEATFNARNVTTGAYDSMIGMAAAVDETAAATEELGAVFEASFAEVTSLTANFGSMIQYAYEYDKITAQLAEYDINGDGFVSMAEATEDATGKAKELLGALDSLANQAALNMMQATIAIGGVTKAEAKLFFDTAVAMGEMTRTGADAAYKAYADNVDLMNALDLDPKTGEFSADDTAFFATVMADNDLTLTEKIAIIKARLDDNGSAAALNALTADRWVTIHTTMGGIQPKAEGGPVLGGSSYLVGERGPETFIAAENGRILSRADSLNAVSQSANEGGGGVTNNYNLTLSTTANANQVKQEFELMEAWA